MFEHDLLLFVEIWPGFGGGGGHIHVCMSKRRYRARREVTRSDHQACQMGPKVRAWIMCISMKKEGGSSDHQLLHHLIDRLINNGQKGALIYGFYVRRRWLGLFACLHLRPSDGKPDASG